jgi:hypothetical protein
VGDLLEGHYLTLVIFVNLCCTHLPSSPTPRTVGWRPESQVFFKKAKLAAFKSDGHAHGLPLLVNPICLVSLIEFMFFSKGFKILRAGFEVQYSPFSSSLWVSAHSKRMDRATLLDAPFHPGPIVAAAIQALGPDWLQD